MRCYSRSLCLALLLAASLTATSSLSGCATTTTQPLEVHSKPLERERDSLVAQLAMMTLIGNEAEVNRINRRLIEINEELRRLRDQEIARDIRSREEVEKDKIAQGLSIATPVVEIVELSLDPVNVPAGSVLKVYCKYDAYGGGVDSAPQAYVSLWQDGQQLLETAITATLYAGRYSFEYEQPFPAEAPAGSYEILVKVQHGDSVAERSAACTVTAPSSAAAQYSTANTSTAVEPPARQAYLDYVQQLSRVTELESAASQAFARARRKEGFQMADAFESETLPAFRHYDAALQRIEPQSRETRDVHQVIIGAAEERTVGLQDIIAGIRALSKSRVEEGNAKIQISEAKMAQWKQHIAALSAKYGGY